MIIHEVSDLEVEQVLAAGAGSLAEHLNQRLGMGRYAVRRRQPAPRMQPQRGHTDSGGALSARLAKLAGVSTGGSLSARLRERMG